MNPNERKRMRAQRAAAAHRAASAPAPVQKKPTPKKKPDVPPVTIAAVLLVLVVVLSGLAASCREKRPGTPAAGSTQSTVQSVSQETTPPAEPTAEPAPTPEPTPTADPAAAYYQKVTERAQANVTNGTTQVNDPALWQQNADELLDRLCADPYYQNAGIDLSVTEGFDYLLAVNRAASTVTVYAANESGQYRKPFMAMVCSGGQDTPTGYFSTPINYPWRLLSGPCYGQYATRIWNAYLFHSVPYYNQFKDDLEYAEYNKLGTPASLGCIRLAVVDVKWIFDHCPIGTKVIIYDDEADPGPMGKPGSIWIDPENVELRGWDPTDPDPANPWEDRFVSGTAIRSDEAQTQWEQEFAAGTWNSTITPGELQGWNHDVKTEGTRG